MNLRPWLFLAASWGAGAALVALPATAQQTQQVLHPEARYQEGVRLFSRQLYGPAQAAFAEYLRQPAVQADPERAADATYYAAVSGLRLLQPDAESKMLRFAAAYPAHPKAALAFFELGRFYFERKDYAQTITNFTKVGPALLNPEQRTESEFKLAYAYFSTKESEKARILFDRNKKGTHEYAAASSYYAGYLGFRANDLAGAKTDLNNAAKSPAYKPVVPQLLTGILYREGNLAEVIAYGEAALAIKPAVQGTDEIKLLVGDSYFQQENYAQALPSLAAAAGKPGMTRGPRGEALLEYKTGFAAYKVKEYPMAVQRFQPVAALRDTLGQYAAYHLGLSYLRADNKPFALTAFNQARITPLEKKVTEQATFKVAEINFEQGDTRAVIQTLTEFNQKFPKSKLGDAADDMLSESYLNSSDYVAAIKYVEGLGSARRTTKINNLYQRVTFYQASQDYNAGQPEAALVNLNKSVQHPGDAELRAAATFLKGEALSGLGRWDDAADAYANVFRDDVKAGQTNWYRLSRYGLGYALYNTKQYDKALIHFKSFVENADSARLTSAPNVVDATLRLADCYFVAKDYQKSLFLYDKVLAAGGAAQDVALFQKGVTLGLSGQREQAIATLGQLVTRFPKSPLFDNALFQQALFDFEAGRYAQAADGFTAMLTQAPQSGLVPQALVKRGVAYSNQQQTDKAVLDFKNVLDNYASNKVAEAALFSLQEALTAAGRTEEFDPYLQAFKLRNPGTKSLETVEFEAAKSLYFAEKYPQAVPKFEAFLKQYPSNGLAADARYFIADSYVRGGDKKTGSQKLDEVIQEGRTQYMNKAVNRAADLALETNDLARANELYARLASSATSRREVGNAQLGLLKGTYASGDYARTRQIATDILAAGSSTVNATNLALLYRAKSALATGQTATALEELRTAAKSASDDNGAEAQYLIAKTLYGQKEYKGALDEAIKVNQNFGGFELWLGRSYLLLADIYSAQGEVFQARATLNSLIDGKFPVAEVLTDAKQKLASLSASGKTDVPVTADPNQPAPKKRTVRSSQQGKNTNPNAQPGDSTR